MRSQDFRRSSYFRLSLVPTLALGFAVGCAAGSTSTPGSGGKSGTGSGGSNSTGSGGSNSTSSGGSNGTSSGGSNGTSSGGSNGTSSGGSNGTSSGGTGSGGTSTGSGGKTNTGGSGTGTGGTGTGTGGSSTGTGGASTGTPAGWWTYTPKSWAGCSWTGIDTVANTTTTNTPKDFLTKPAADPYCVAGTVNPTNESVALLGFNLAEPVAGADCSYKVTTTPKILPAVTLTGTGIAVAFSKKIATDMRVQVQGPNGATDANDRWCAKITEPAGPVFVPYTAFNTKCWDNSGTTFNPANNKVAAVVFLVAGATTPIKFDYCIGGFNTGSSVSDAPSYSGGGPVTGMIGGPGDTTIDYQRVKVAAGGKSYVVQNNNWGNPASTNQTLQYTDNSFKVTGETGASPDGMKPASFPSIFIGASGDTQMGTFSTHLNNGTANQAGDNLPKQISAIQSVKSTFRYNNASGDYNATYDIWFASGLPTSAYDDGISGFVMVWLYKPGNRSPIGGSATRTNVTIPGAPGTWNVWVGPRGSGTNPNRPVVSYVATSTIMTFTNVDLKPFITDAAMHGISNSWYLTDVFGGFEIWNGSGTNNLSLQEFTAVVQ